MITHSSAKPLYIQVKESLEKDIRKQKYTVGTKLPSEKSFVKSLKSAELQYVRL